MHYLKLANTYSIYNEIPGNKKSMKTELYMHVTDNRMKQIKTPFDDL